MNNYLCSCFDQLGKLNKTPKATELVSERVEVQPELIWLFYTLTEFFSALFKIKPKYILIGLFSSMYISAAAGGILSCDISAVSCGIWDIVPWPGIKPRSPALGVWSLSHQTTREASCSLLGWGLYLVDLTVLPFYLYKKKYFLGTWNTDSWICLLWTVTAAMKLKDACSLEEKV